LRDHEFAGFMGRFVLDNRFNLLKLITIWYIMLYCPTSSEAGFGKKLTRKLKE
jgi:hypothetical protein